MLPPGSPVLPSRGGEGGQEKVVKEDRTAEDRTARTMIVVPKCAHLAALSCHPAEESAVRRRQERRTGY